MPDFDLQTLLTQFPDPKGGKMPPTDADLVNDLGHDLIQAGRAAVTALVASLEEVDDGSDWKSRFLLNALAIHVGEAGHAVEESLCVGRRDDELHAVGAPAAPGLLVPVLEVPAVALRQVPLAVVAAVVQCA